MVRSLVLAQPGLVSLQSLLVLFLQFSKACTYKDETTHHVHAGAQAGEHEDLVTGDQPLSAGL